MYSTGGATKRDPFGINCWMDIFFTFTQGFIFVKS
jgi:hypothetical protein